MVGDSHAIARRVSRTAVALAAAGAAILALSKGPRWGLSFLVGAALSMASFHLTHLLVLRLGPQDPQKGGTSAFKSVLMGLRYAILGAAAYATIEGLGLHLEAVLGGLLVAVAATLVEILYELIHGT